MLFTFLILLIGFMFAFRISTMFIAQNTLSKKHMTKIGTVYLLSVFILIGFVSRSYFRVWLVVFSPQLVIYIAILVLKRRRETLFRRYFYGALNIMILKMKSGRSLRQALGEVIKESPPFMQSKLSEVFEVVVFLQQKLMRGQSPFVIQVIEELRNADQNSHRSLRLLEVFRDRIRTEDDFRRRSGQVLKQIRAQSLLISGLYLAVLLFVSHQFGFAKNSRTIVSSMTLFLLGLLWIYLGGRKMKWKT